MNRYRVRTKTDAIELTLRHLAGQPEPVVMEVLAGARSDEESRIFAAYC